MYVNIRLFEQVVYDEIIIEFGICVGHLAAYITFTIDALGRIFSSKFQIFLYQYNLGPAMSIVNDTTEDNVLTA